MKAADLSSLKYLESAAHVQRDGSGKFSVPFFFFLVEGISTEKNDTVASRAELQGLSELIQREGFEKCLAPLSKQVLKNVLSLLRYQCQNKLILD